MKTLTTQYPSPGGKLSRKLLPALLVVLLSICGFTSRGQTLTATIGTGTSVYSATSTIPAPLGYYSPSARMAYLYTATELTAAGFTAGAIHQISFDVGTLGTATGANGYTVGIGFTTASTLLTTGWPATTTVINHPAGYPPSAGWNNLTFNTGGPIVWNGTSNIVIEVCYAAGGSGYGPGNAGVRYTAATSQSVYYQSTGASICGLPIPPQTTLTYKPNIRFTRLAFCNHPSMLPITAGTLTPSGTTSTLCPGTRVTIASTNYTNAQGISFQWWTSSTATGPWVHAQGDSAKDRYLTPPLVSNTYYRLVVKCSYNGDSAVSAVTGFTFPGGFPVYGALPYFEGFENWSNGCATNDKISSNNWTNIPITGYSSWRRDDQGASAAWANVTAPITPYESLHSARWHGYLAPVGDGGAGVLQLYVNTSATANAKDLSFYYQFIYATPQPTYPIDSLIVDVSSDGGATFNALPNGKIGAAFGPAGTWNLVTIPNIAVSSPTTVFRFKAKHGNAAGYIDDIYLDAVRIDPPCTGKPVAGVIDTIIACSGQPFKLKLRGNVPAAGLTYNWQYRAPGTGLWTSFGGSVASPTFTMTSATDFRVIVTCTNTTPNVSDTTPIYPAQLAPFYYCYCTGSISSSYGGGQYSYVLVGNTTLKTEPAGVTLLNNGNPLPTLGGPHQPPYEDFRRTVAPPTLILDSSYRLFITQQNSYGNYFYTSYANAWLDRNRDGTFQTTELIMNNRSISNAANPTTSQVFQILPTQPVGITGLRVSDFMYNSPAVTPCGIQNNYGQYEDYLVRIEYQPCTGPVNPGTAWASDSVMCPGYTVDLYDTSYERTRTNILRMWEVSTNGGASFSAIPGSAQLDTMKNVVVTATSQYRLRVICGPSGDTTWSNAITVRAPEPVRCYPVSWAAPGGGTDTSDIGAFILGNFVNPDPSFPAGPHLLNPLATKRRTDYTLMTPMIELHADSTYRLAIFHTMPRGFHHDAMISVFIDFNNDMDYDITAPPPPSPYTSELVFQGISVFDSFFLDTKIKMPNAVIPNVPTGMRVVLNNNTSPSAPGNTGSGVFTSGEVEDYVVIFRRPNLGTGNPTLLQNLALYPNPTEGKFTVLSDASRAVSHLDVVVTTITGQQVINRSFDNVGTSFRTDLDLSNQAKGVYFVEIRADGEKITKKLVVR